MNRESFWNDENTARAKELALQGLSGREIGEALGCSRNAVIGRLFRIGGPKLKGVSRPFTYSPWSDTMLVALEDGCAKGLSAYQISALLGISRETVRDQIRRRGLTKSKIVRARAPAQKRTWKPKPKLKPVPKRAEVACEPRPWITRSRMECAWPVDGEGADTRSCCNPTDGGPYCAGHAAWMVRAA